MHWSNDNSAVDVIGVKRNLTNQNGTVDLSIKAKLTQVGWGSVTKGTFSASTVISIEYL